MERPDWWYEPDVEPETPADYGWIHEDDCPDIEHCEDMLKGVIEAIYRTGDLASLEDCLDELTSQFGMKIPDTKPVLEKTANVRTNRMLGEWLQFNQSYNENILNIASR